MNTNENLRERVATAIRRTGHVTNSDKYEVADAVLTALSPEHRKDGSDWLDYAVTPKEKAQRQRHFERAEMLDALRPLAALLHEGEVYQHDGPDEQVVFAINKAKITLGDLRRARNILAKAGAK